MKLYEYAAKKIFSDHNIPVPESSLISNAGDAAGIVRKFGISVIKAQVTAGGRGKAGGILTVEDPEEGIRIAEKILDMEIKGLPVKKVLIEEYREHEKEFYLGITIDRKRKCPIIMASSEGGVDIEEIARVSPGKIKRVYADPLTGIHDYQARYLADSLDRERSSLIADVIKKLYSVFIKNDCILAEINPLVTARDGVFALDAKMVIDDNALFRQEFVEEEQDSFEYTAKKNGMSYVDLEGNIGCIVNGAGLAMATLDLINEEGGKPANFMDVRAGANAEQVSIALKIISSNRNVKVIIINIFGGITKCDEVARGITEIIPEIKVPVVVRLSGTNEDKGKKMLEDYGLLWASSSEEAAKEVVGLVHTY